jgi:hypothetical protein
MAHQSHKEKLENALIALILAPLAAQPVAAQS